MKKLELVVGGWLLVIGASVAGAAVMKKLMKNKEEDVSVTNCVPGFYYTLFGAAGVRALPTTETKYETKPCGVSGEVTFPAVEKPSDAAGFFSIGARETSGVNPSDAPHSPVTILE